MYACEYDAPLRAGLIPVCVVWVLDDQKGTNFDQDLATAISSISLFYFLAKTTWPKGAWLIRVDTKIGDS
jgi:hypothetical protein